MNPKYTAADLLDVARGKRSLRREMQVITDPLPAQELKPTTPSAQASAPLSRQADVTARDILALSRHRHPWHALASDSNFCAAG